MPKIDEPLTFTPLYMERVWGGRSLESIYHRTLPNPDQPFGESWEVVDRPDEQSVVNGGALSGKSLHDLWRDHRETVFGSAYADHPSERFPLLVKILDACDKLSIQVHPPASVASSLGGEPKTEMWFIAHAEPGARLYVGLKEGIDAEAFKRGLEEGKTADQVHEIQPKEGEFIFIPSGRLHAIGAGLVIYEIQQNSDTTYRVFDWNRLGLSGEPRDLHLEESLQCIDFTDIEPSMDVAAGEVLVDDDLFRIEQWKLKTGESRIAAPADCFSLITVVSEKVSCGKREFVAGDFFIIPAGADSDVRTIEALGHEAMVLCTTLPIG